MLRRAIAAVMATAVIGALAPAAGAGNDPMFNQQWGLKKVQADSAWAVADGTGATIAIVDTGVDLDHPDLKAKIINLPDADFVEPAGTCPTPGSSKDCKQDGAQDRDGHGTHVAGIAGAITGNGIGVAGTAPGAALLPVRVLDEDGSGTTQWVADGIRYAARKGADVINLSLTYGPDAHLFGGLRPVKDAIAFASARGAVVVVAAGNDSVPLCAEPRAATVICVGALDQRDGLAWYSDFDALGSDTYLVAPGGEGLISCANDIVSTYLRGQGSLCATDGYDAIAGTSMAAPFVSGIAALLVELGLDNSEIVDCLTGSADDVGLPGRDALFGYGRVNALRAVTECAG